MLPFFAILLFSLVGIGALVIDGGLALTEQARLETATEMLVAEWAHVEALSNDELPSECVSLGARQADCLEAVYLAPLLNPLGVAFARAAGGETLLQHSDTALDGRAIDSRGARFGSLVPRGVLDEGSPESIRLERSSPLLFGWATLPAQGATNARPDFLDVEAARAEQGISPDLDGSGLYAEGFSLSAHAAIDPVGTPAIRVGPPIPDTNAPGHHVTGGVVGVAWLLSDLQRDLEAGGERAHLAIALESQSGDTDFFEPVDQTLRTPSGEPVACLFDARGSGRHLDQPLGGGVAALAPARFPSAYVPVVESCDPSTPILGFLELGIDARDPAAIRVDRSAGLRRNAAASPGDAAQGTAVARILRDPARAQLQTTNAWRREGLDLALRVPNVSSFR